MQLGPWSPRVGGCLPPRRRRLPDTLDTPVRCPIWSMRTIRAAYVWTSSLNSLRRNAKRCHQGNVGDFGDDDMFDEVDIGEDDSSGEASEEGNQVAKSVRSASSVSVAVVKNCGMPGCKDIPRGKDKWCKRHQNHYNNRRYEKEHNKVNGSVEAQASVIIILRT